MYPIQVKHIRQQAVQHFTLWDGEKCATVFMHVGLHGFPDAVIVLREPDGPMQTFQWNKGYELEFSREGTTQERHTQRVQAMKEWVAAQLNMLAAGHIDPALRRYLVLRQWLHRVASHTATLCKGTNSFLHKR